MWRVRRLSYINSIKRAIRSAADIHKAPPWSPRRPRPFQPVLVRAYVEDVMSGVESGLLRFRVNYGDWNTVEMTVRYCGSITKAILHGVIPGLPKGCVVQFYIVVYDRAENEARSPIYTYVVGGKGAGLRASGRSLSLPPAATGPSLARLSKKLTCRFC